MTTAPDPDPTADPAAESAVRRMLATVAAHLPDALVFASAGMALMPQIFPGDFANLPPALAALVTGFGVEALGILYGLYREARQGAPPDDQTVLAEVRRAQQKATAQTNDVLRQIARLTVTQQQMARLLAADFELGQQLIAAYAAQGITLQLVAEQTERIDRRTERIEEKVDALARPAAAIPQQRPPAAPHFTGREAELADLRAALQPGRVVTVTGIGGMGKTSLAAAAIAALEAGGELARRFPGGVIVHSFYDDNDIQRAAAHIATSCDHDPRPHPLDAARVALGGRVALLVLDGAEAADNLPKLLDARGRSGVLVTSRAKRDVHDVEIPLKRLSPDEAVALLQQWGQELAADRDAAAAIGDLVGNLPLAVTLAGQYLWESQTPAAEYLDWLRDAGLAALDFGGRRRESVPVLLDKSLAEVALRAAAARDVVAVLGALALAPVGVEPLAAALDEPAAALRPALAALTGYGLLRRDGGYRLTHPLLHQYARERLAVPPAALARLAAYYTQYAETHSAEGPPGYRLLDAQRPHIMALLPRLQTVELWVELNDLVWVVHSYMDVAGHAFDRLEALGYGVTAARALGRRHDEGAHLNLLGIAHADLGRVEEAITFCEQALAISREIGDRRTEGAILGNLGIANRQLGQAEVAIGFYEQALAISRETGDKRDEGSSLGAVGLAYADLGRVEVAIGCYQQALAISRETGDRRGELTCLGNLGSAHADLGRIEEAIGFNEQALAISRETGDRRAEGAILGNLGNFNFSLGRVEAGIGFTQQALSISRAIGDRRGEGYWLGALGLAHAALGRVKAAIGFITRALAISRETGDRRSEGGHLGNLGNAYADLGQVEEAIGFYEQALAISRETGDRRAEGNWLGALGNAHAALGRVEAAIGFYEQALAISRETGDRRAEGNGLGSMGNAYHSLGRVEEAISFYEQALAISRETGDRRAEGNRLANLGKACHQIGDVDRAVALVEEALAIYDAIKAPTTETVRGWLAQWRGDAAGSP